MASNNNSINLTLMTHDGAITTTAVSKTDKISALCARVTTSFRIPASDQRFIFNNQPIGVTETFSSAGIGDGDLLMVMQIKLPLPSAPAAPVPASAPAPPPATNAPGISPVEQELLNNITNDPTIMGALRSRYPQLYNRIQSGDPSASRQLLEYLQSSVNGMVGANNPNANAAQNSVPTGLDPMSVEGQKEIEERIRQENVNENMHAALEHNPESFGRVVMLFVDCKINSVSGKAFVDSGAQTTIISRVCAEKCGILHLMDTRFHGIARGVGTAKILGRIHLTLLTLGNQVFEITLTVMDSVGSSYDILLGLDMLRKHNAIIDLSKNCLRIGDVAVPFLGEKDIPVAMREEAGASDNDKEEAQQKGESSNQQNSKPTSSPVTPSSSRQQESNQMGSSSTNNNRNEDIEKIIELGFSREEAEHALNMCQGDAEQAIATLVSAKFDG